MNGPIRSIGSQVKGEIGEVVKEIGKSVASIPSQIIEGPAKNSDAKSGDSEGKALEAGQQIGDDTQAKKQQQTSGQGFGDAIKSQLGLSSSQQQNQQRLTEVRRNLEKEIQAVRKQKQQKEEQQKQQEEQQKQMIEEKKKEQKQEVQKQKAAHGLGPGQFGKGETRGAKGK